MKSSSARSATRDDGRFYPLGATPLETGVNFALYSEHAEEIHLHFFDDSRSERPAESVKMTEKTRNIFHCFMDGARPGLLYGYTAHGPWDPRRGLRFNRNKLLIDPYARALTHKFDNRDNLLLGYDPLSPGRDLVPDGRDSAALAPKCIVMDDSFDWRGDKAPDIPFPDLVIYEVHVKGFTAHPSSGVSAPGTYLGFAEKIPYLKGLGVNAVELLPVHEHYDEDFLSSKGLSNYWGYNTAAFFAPEQSYSSGRAPGCQVAEFKTLVRELHAAGIEVILDVVYNHTAEGSELGPSLSFRGIDNPVYYRLTGGPSDPGRYYLNLSGCGNTLNLSHPAVIRLVLDSLRYWVECMHVDGFRFDLASALGREGGDFEKTASFFDAISQDPVLCRVKLIAEPWDLGTYQVGNFPVDWSEWNGRYRDTIRRLVKGDSGQLRELGYRLTGSADMYADDGRSAYNSVNFITCHDGFTLHDLVSYNEKHNEANLEGNRDGSPANDSWNCGAEGETRDPGISALRMRQMKNSLALLVLSAGTPMILSGDEAANTQKGNNNAYCQDNPISWLDWERARGYRDLTGFTSRLIALRKSHPVFMRSRFFTGRDANLNEVPDLSWFDESGKPPAWNDQEARSVALLMDESETRGGKGILFMIVNAHWVEKRFALPDLSAYKLGKPGAWRRIMDTSLPEGREFTEPGAASVLDPQTVYPMAPRSVTVLEA